MIKLFFIVSVAISCIYCQQKLSNSAALNYEVNYELDDPNKKHDLPKSLDEVSGIAYLPKNLIVAVQDEKGILYTYDLSKKEVIDKFEFGSKGDYEGLCIAKNTIKILSANGELYSVNIDHGSKNKIPFEKIKIDAGTEIEGICWLYKNKYLIAYKGRNSNDALDERDIYQFDESTNQQQKLFSINNKKLRIYFDNQEDLSKGLKKIEDNLSRIKPSFYPSDIDIHPKTKEIYIISSVNKLLLIVHPTKFHILHIHQFDKEKVPQPEGITFESDGTMYISSEKSNRDEARIFKFNMK